MAIYKDKDMRIHMFEGRKIHFIRAVREATGANLRLAKMAVDICIADDEAELDMTSATGSSGDFIKTVRFLIDINRKFGVDFRNASHLLPNGDSAIDILLDVKRAIKEGEERDKGLYTFSIDYWKKGPGSYADYDG